MIIRHVKNNSFTREETNSLYMLFLEEEIIGKLLNSNSATTKYEHKLLQYAKENKFKLSDIGTVSTFDFYEMVKKYEFIVIKDKRNVVFGYLCFEKAKIGRIDSKNNRDIFIIKHMYISNSQNHTQMDYKMFWLMENLVEKCVIYSDIPYRPCNQFNGFAGVGKNYLRDIQGYVKVKEEVNFPLFMNSWNRSCMLSMLSVVLNTQDRSCKI